MSFLIRGLSPNQFRPFFAMSDAELQRVGAVRVIADTTRFPCRVSMEHANIGEELLLLNFKHQPANTPYQAAHAIYVRKVANAPFEMVDFVPEVLASRLLAIRAFDTEHMMIAADVCQGVEAAAMFERFLATPQTAYLQVHNALRGCYAARVERA